MINYYLCGKKITWKQVLKLKTLKQKEEKKIYTQSRLNTQKVILIIKKERIGLVKL